MQVKFSSHFLGKKVRLMGRKIWYLFLVYLSISTCFGRLCAHHQEKQLCLYDTYYLLFYVDDWYPHRITSTKCRTNTVVSPDDGHIVTRNM